MIVSRINGGLGNQLFQYAVARSIGNRLNVPVGLDLRDYTSVSQHKFGLDKFRIDAQIVRPKDLGKLGIGSANNITLFARIIRRLANPILILESDFKFNDVPRTVKSRNVYLDGYWQSEQYFSNIRGLLLSEIVSRDPLSPRTQELDDLIRGQNAVSVHIRRGDYISNPSTHAFHGICSPDYYKRSIDYIKNTVERPVFYFFSDDIKWCRENLRLDIESSFIDHTNAITAHEDLHLMRLCKHNIIANSTFSWWGAWLNQFDGKIVIAPEKWFSGSTLDSSRIVPENWLKF